jgi:23S rRNA (adenine2503-C2)-methyltransferase
MTNTQVWENVKCIPSSDENVRKYVFTNEIENGAVAEAVLYKYPTYEDRTVICCSTQSGCPVGCRFCGTGEFFIRSLTGDEIVAQVQHLFADRGIDQSKVKRTQIMFMSMGEPLLNKQGLTDALRKLYALYPTAALLISTSAPDVDYQWVRDISIEIPTVGLQFSVHESYDAARDKLIPFKAKLNLEQIAQEGENWYHATGRQPFFNYCANEHNSSDLDATRLYVLFDPRIWQATISVVCEQDESVAAANARQRQLAQDFMTELMEFGFSTRCFDPAGQDDIGGGCGQLWFVQDYAKNHPELTRKSCGAGLEKVHAPRVIEIMVAEGKNE